MAAPADQSLRDPLLAASAAFIFGAYYGPPSHPALVVVFMLVSLAGAIAMRVRRGRWAGIPLFGAGFAAGLCAVWAGLPDPDPLIARVEALAGRPVLLSGRVAEIADATPYGTAAIVELESIGTSTASSLEAIEGRARLTIAGASEVDYGARLEAVVALSPPDTKLVPAFRARGVAVRRGVSVTGGVREVLSLDGHRAGLPRRAGDPTLMAIAFGERALADPAREAALVKGGASYVFALSGAAMIAVVLGLFMLLARRRSPRLAAQVCAVLALLLLLAQGGTPASMRVAITCLVILLWSAIADRVEVRRPLALAIIVVLAVDPAALGDVQYQLGVASLTACVTVYPAIAEYVRLKPLAFLLAVAMATAPLITRQFDRITLLSLTANMVTLPLAIVVIAPLSLLGAALGSISHFLAAAPLALAELTLRLVEALAVPSSLAVATPSVAECALFYGAMLGFVARPATKASRAFAALNLVVFLVVAVSSRVDRVLRHEPNLAALPGGFVVDDDPEKGVLVFGTGEQLPDPEASTRILDTWLKRRRITRISQLTLPGPSPLLTAVRRQHDVDREVFATDPLAQVAPLLPPGFTIAPGLIVRAPDEVYDTHVDGVVTIERGHATAHVIRRKSDSSK